MKQGMGIVVALLVVSVAGTIYFTTRVDSDAKRTINPQAAEQLKGINEFQINGLNGALNSYSKRNENKMPTRAEELIPDYIHEIPKEAFSGLSSTVSVYDGKGGWVYDGISFRPNHDQKPNVE